MNRMNVSCLRLQSYGDICHLPNNFSEKAETYSDTRANMRQKGRRVPNLSHGSRIFVFLALKLCHSEPGPM